MKNKWPVISGNNVIIVPIKTVLGFTNPEDAPVVANAMSAYGKKMYEQGFKIGGVVGAVVALGSLVYVTYRAKKEEES